MGILVLVLEAAMLIAVAVCVRKKYPAKWSVNDYIYAGGSVPEKIQIISMFSMWMWTTSILGATEAGINYGLMGGAAYALGADLGFYVMIYTIRGARRRYGNEFFLTDFIKDQFPDYGISFFFVIIVLMPAYTVVQQVVGFSNVFSTLWGLPYKIIAVGVALLVSAFVVAGGMRGVLLGDVVYSFVILFSLAAMIGIAVFGRDGQVFQAGFSLMKEDFGFNLRPGTLYPFLRGLISYVIVMAILGVSETVLDPTFYMKANLTKDEKQMERVFLWGGIYLWTPLVILVATVMGALWRAYMGTQQLEGLNTNLLTKVLFADNSSIGMKIAFSAAIGAVVVTTIANIFLSILSLMVLRGHKAVTGEEGTDAERLRFGMLFMIMLALFCGLIALSLDNISLFVINIVCGIFFAAPCGAVLFFQNRGRHISGYLLVTASIFGIVAGIVVWLKTDDSGYSLLFGTMVSFMVPYLISRIN